MRYKVEIKDKLSGKLVFSRIWDNTTLDIVKNVISGVKEKFDNNFGSKEFVYKIYKEDTDLQFEKSAEY